jgi:hypothetical protein
MKASITALIRIKLKSTDKIADEQYAMELTANRTPIRIYIGAVEFIRLKEAHPGKWAEKVIENVIIYTPTTPRRK